MAVAVSAADGAGNPGAGAGAARLAQEAARLVDVLQGAGRDAGGASGAPEHAGPECRVCPLCRGLALLREVRPETVAALVAAATDLATALRDALVPEGTPGRSGWGGSSDGPPGPSVPSDRPPDRPRGPTARAVPVHHIEIDD